MPEHSWKDRLKAWPQYIVPGHLISRLTHAITRIRYHRFKNAFIGWFVRSFQVDLTEAQITNPYSYEHFNAFFTRALKPEARPIVNGRYEVACPVDGAVSQVGEISHGQLFQAKGHSYSLLELLGGSDKRAAPFQNGAFATIYLSPRDYHRIHMPLGGVLREMVHVPGRLFSVNAATVKVIPRVFARNERVISIFDTAFGPMALVKVGAINVGSIETVWAGEVTPPAGQIVRSWHYPADGEEAVSLERGAEMGRFNMGSTVIVLFGHDAIEWSDSLQPGAVVRLGQLLATRKG
ncbi:MAG TPA: archaetidylserine decarboxylase [Gammaproteobacteria bacterium]